MTRDFSYRAYTADGEMVAGMTSARTEVEALRALGAQGLIPFDCRRAGAAAGSAPAPLFARRFSRTDTGLILRDLTAFLEASLPMDAALRMAAAQRRPRRRKAVIEKLHEAVVSGAPLSDAMRAQPGVFSPTQTAAVKAGEMAGVLPRVLKELGEALRRDLELRGRILGAFFYPAILLATAVLALSLVLFVTVPAIAPLFDGQKRPMPLVLALAGGFRAFLQSYGLFLLPAALACGAALAALLRSPRFQARRDALLLRAPLIGPMVAQAETVRFARTFGMLVGSGAPVPSALAVTAAAMENGATRAALGEAAGALKRGVPLMQALGAFAALPESSRSLIAAAEQTNRLPEMLARVAELNEKDLSRTIERLMTLLTPALTVGIGALVGGIILSVMSAVLSTNDLAF